MSSRTSEGGFTVASSAYRLNDGPPPSTSRRGDGGNVEDARRIAKIHWREFRGFLIRQGNGKDISASRSNARDKLTRLTRQQFQELSTDVYDELMRRSADPSVAEPFLPVKNEFHPKRNQARQKLATLPPGRFKDLAHDVYTELDRRYPEFGEDEKQMEREQQRIERERADQYNPYANQPTSPASIYNPQNTFNNEGTLTRRPNLQVAPSAASEVLVPNKSVLVEDDGPSYPPRNDELSPQSFTESPPTYNGQLPRERSDSKSNADSFDAKTNPNSDYFEKMARNSEASSVGGRFLANFASTSERTEDKVSKDEMEKLKSDYEYKIANMQRKLDDLEKDLLQRQSELTEEREGKQKLQADLRREQQKADDQSVSIQSLQRDLTNVQSRLSESQSQLAKARSTTTDETSLSRLKRDLDVAEREKDDMRRSRDEHRREIQGLLDELRAMAEKTEELMRARERDEEELEGLKAQMLMYKKKYEQAKTELRNVKATSQLFINANTPSLSAEAFPVSEGGALIDIHVTTFQSNMDELLSSGRSQSPSSVLGAMKNLVETVSKIDADIAKFETTSTYRQFSVEDRDRLQNLKAKSSATLTNLMVAAKTHATSFGISPVSLLDAAASHLAQTIVELTKLVKVRRATSQEVEESNMIVPRATTNTPPITSRVDRFKQNETSYIPRSPPAGQSSIIQSRQNTFDSTGSSNSSERGYGTSRFEDRYGAPKINGVTNGGRNGYGRKTTDDSMSPVEPTNGNKGFGSESERARYEPPSARQEEVESSTSERSELKMYLDTQTENIVSSIQSLLSAIRGGAPNSQLDENLNEIITIVTSIVAISQDRIPLESRAQGEPIIQELADGCDRLTEMQNSNRGMFNKVVKQNMANCCFGIAKNLKQLNSAVVI